MHLMKLGAQQIKGNTLGSLGGKKNNTHTSSLVVDSKTK